MSKLAAEFIRAQAAALRGADLDQRRGEEIAADIGRIDEAANEARRLLDFNDEPARFIALLAASAAPAGRRQ